VFGQSLLLLLLVPFLLVVMVVVLVLLRLKPLINLHRILHGIWSVGE
jgi:hypothetical protein